MPKVFTDANVLLEVLMTRQRYKQCDQLIRVPDNSYFIAALSVHIVWYVAESYHIPLEKVRRILKYFEIIPLTEQAIVVADSRYDGQDFEDCLQAACAELGGCNQILTLDKNFKKHSKTKLLVRVVM